MPAKKSQAPHEGGKTKKAPARRPEDEKSPGAKAGARKTVVRLRSKISNS
jgi:hypothetical protein